MPPSRRTSTEQTHGGRTHGRVRDSRSPDGPCAACLRRSARDRFPDGGAVWPWHAGRNRLNSGAVVVGTMGDISKLDYTIIVDAVNVAARVEAFTRQTGDRILLTAATRDLPEALRAGLTGPSGCNHSQGPNRGHRVVHSEPIVLSLSRQLRFRRQRPGGAIAALLPVARRPAPVGCAEWLEYRSTARLASCSRATRWLRLSP